MLQQAYPDPGSRHRELCRVRTASQEKKPGFHTSSMLSQEVALPLPGNSHTRSASPFRHQLKLQFRFPKCQEVFTPNSIKKP